MNLKIRLELFEKELLSLPLRIVRFDMLFQFKPEPISNLPYLRQSVVLRACRRLCINFDNTAIPFVWLMRRLNPSRDSRLL